MCVDEFEQLGPVIVPDRQLFFTDCDLALGNFFYMLQGDEIGTVNADEAFVRKPRGEGLEVLERRQWLTSAL